MFILTFIIFLFENRIIVTWLGDVFINKLPRSRASRNSLIKIIYL